MLKLLNKIYRKDNVTKDIVNAVEKKIDEIESKVNDLYKQTFLNYATWYLAEKEREMGLNKKLDDLEKRRAYVKTRLLGTGTATKELLESTANTVPGVEVEIEFKNMTVIINFLKCENNKYLTIVKRAVENMMPYHLDLELKYDHVNWGEIKGVTWGKLLSYTWGSISKSVSGTILGGLDDDFD